MTVVQADIASIQVDAIVHPTSSNYSLAGEIGTALAKVGGTVFTQELRNMEKDNGPIDLNGGWLAFYAVLFDCFTHGSIVTLIFLIDGYHDF